MPEVGNRRVLAFDFGTRRIGVATGQEMLGTGQPLAMIPARDGVPDWAQIEALLAEWQPNLVLVGLPLNMDDTENDMCARARKFGKRIHGRYHVLVEMVDERLTSFEAKGRVIADGGSRDFGRHGVDDLAAVLILKPGAGNKPAELINEALMTALLDINPLLDELEAGLRDVLERRSIKNPALIGIRTGGVWIADILNKRLGLKQDFGELDISFYRDDFSRIGLNPTVTPSSLAFDTEGRDIILVDDVIMSGRTIRAAMNEIFDYGRPASIILATLIDLGARELPIQPDVVGKVLELETYQRVKLRGPEPLRIEFQETGQ